MDHCLEDDCEEDEAAPGRADEHPVASVKEGDVVVDRWCLAGFLTERTSTVQNVVVAVKGAVGRNGVLTGIGRTIQNCGTGWL